MRYLSSSLRFACAALALSAPLQAGQVDLRAPDGTMSISGDLKFYDDTAFVLATAIGEIRVPRSVVQCFGVHCPKGKDAPADLVLRGSDTIGDRLMPLLMNGYAASMGGAFAKIGTVSADTQHLDLRADNGAGATMMVAQIQAAGSSTGLHALIAGETDIAMSSRPARETEVEAIRAQDRGDLRTLAQEYIIGVDSILVIVHPDNPVSALTMDQLSDVFAGRITNWADLGGPNQAIHVITRPESSGTRGVFEEAVLTPALTQMNPAATVIGGNAEIAEVVARDPAAIAYLGFAYLGDTKTVDLISSCGLPMKATAFAAKAEEYPLERRLRLFVDNTGSASHARGLLDFAISPAADAYLREAGFIDLSVAQDDAAFDLDLLWQSANADPDPGALRLASAMMQDLGQATRLSTTFRFVPDSAELDNKSLRDLDRVVAFLNRPENADRRVFLAGFADSQASFDHNTRLAAERAKVVRRALLNRPGAQTLRPRNLSAVSYSELAPVGCNDSDKGRSANRRVEVWID